MPAPVLILAVGNESRGDDALGPLLLRRLQAWLNAQGLAEQVELIEEFQLQVEHTLDLAGRERVLFIDAGHHTSAPFTFSQAVPRRLEGHTSHAVSPETLLGVYALVHTKPAPPAFILCVAGEQFELGEPLSPRAGQYLQQAFEFACRLFDSGGQTAWQGLATMASAHA